jgi:aminotransferase EvaB
MQTFSDPARVPTSDTIGPVRFDRIYEPLLPALKEAFTRFIRSGNYILGPAVERFEAAVAHYLGALHVIGCKSGTHSLILALKAAGVQPGDEVITVANTYYATVEAIRHVGALPVFVDVEPVYGLLDAVSLAAAVRRGRPRAVLVVHLYGFIADLAAIGKVCAMHDLPLIEDCAHAFGSRTGQTLLGANSNYACFSLYPTKNFGAFGDAGFIATWNQQAARRMKELRYYADEKTRSRFVPDAEHARLDALQAELLVTLMPQVEGWICTRRKYADRYCERLKDNPGIRIASRPPGQEPAFYSLPCFSPQRDRLIESLRKFGVHLQAHYRTNLHHLPHFASSAPPVLPYTERHNAQVFNLPTHPSLTLEEVDRVADALEAYLCRHSS